jgi:hypothetical protein
MSSDQKPKVLSDPQLLRWRLGPSWRLQEARLIASSKQQSDKPADAIVQRAYRHFFAGDHRRPKNIAAASVHDDAIAAAAELEREFYRVLRILTLGGQSDATISEFIGMAEVNIRMWRDLYFDVDGLQRTYGWMERHVFGPLVAKQDRELERELRLARALGPQRVIWLLKDPNKLTAKQTWQLNRAQLELKCEGALELCVDSPRAAFRLVEMYVDLLYREQQLRLDAKRLAEEMRQNARQHEQRLLRLAIQRAREENRAAYLRTKGEKVEPSQEIVLQAETQPSTTTPDGLSAQSQPAVSAQPEQMSRRVA